MHLYKFYLICLATILTDFIDMSDCALLVVAPKRHIKRTNITWKSENFTEILTTKPPLELSSIPQEVPSLVDNMTPEFHFIRHFKHKRRRLLDRNNDSLKSIHDNNYRVVTPKIHKVRKEMRNKTLLRSLLS